MKLTPFGRVEMDPMVVPALTSAKPAQHEAPFARLLESTTRRNESRPREQTPTPAKPEPQPVPPSESRPRAPLARENATSVTPSASNLLADESRGVTPVAESTSSDADATPWLTSPVGSGVESQNGSAPQDHTTTEPRLATSTSERVATLVSAQARMVPVGVPVANAGANANANASQAAPSVTAPTKAIGAPTAETLSNAARTPTAGPTSFRTLDKHTLELAEQARDSVFKQVAFRLGKDGSEVRMLLDPPELGRLDLHLTVDKSGQLSLAMLTERKELAVMLDAHMQELKHTLSQSGFTVTQASVEQDRRRPAHESAHEQHQQHSQQSGFANHRDAPAGAQTAQDLARALARSGWASAEGLDFWV